MKGFILYSTYRIINSKPSILLFGKLENKQSFLTINSYRPYFYIRESDLKHLPKEYDYQKTDFETFKNEKVIRIYTDLPQEIPALRKELENNEVLCYEADIKFTNRFLIDNNLKSLVEINSDDYDSNEFIDRIYYEPVLSPAENFNISLKVFSLDIETSMDGNSLYSISIYSPDFKQSFLISDKKVKNSLAFNTEEELLEKFKQVIIEQDPDIITGWSVIDFDLDFLQKKFKENKIPFNLGRTEQACKLKLESDFFKTSKSDFQGRIILDAIDLLKGSFIRLENYKLSTAASHFLKEKKLIDDYNKGAVIENLHENDPEKLIEYNMKDSFLVFEILKKTRVLDLAVHRSILTGMPLDRINASIASFDSLYLRSLKEKKYVASSSSFKLKESPITGGYVMESLPGIYENIIVLDFKSLYPSIIRTFNIDPLSFVGKPQKGKNLIISPNKVAFRNEQGILPEIISELMKEREIVKKKKDELTSYAIKILLNSFFGVMANPSFRFFNTDMANAITHFGQQIIKQTAVKIRDKGYEVIYQDTDSCFINPKVKTFEEAEIIGKKLSKEINLFFDEYVKKEYHRENCLDLEFEKVFKMFLMPKIRGSETGAKKRYAGLIIEDGKEKIEVTGLESKRRDWTDLAKKFQNELFDRIFHKKEIKNYVKEFIKDVKCGKYDDLLVYRKGLSKKIDKYTKTTPPHVKAARKMNKIGSSIIEYVMTEDGPEPMQELKHKIDYDHYIEKQLKPIADSILIFFNITFDELLQGSKQVTLFNFSKNQ